MLTATDRLMWRLFVLHACCDVVKAGGQPGTHKKQQSRVCHQLQADVDSLSLAAAASSTCNAEVLHIKLAVDKVLHLLRYTEKGPCQWSCLSC